MAWAEAYLCTKWHLDPSSRLTTTNMRRKWGAVPPFRGRGAGSHLACGLGRGLPPYQGHVDPSSRLGTIDMGRKLGAVPPFLGRGAGSQSNTMSLGSRPIFLPSGVLIHRGIWPQQIWAENWGLCPFRGVGPGSHVTMWPGLRPICVPSFILIDATVLPQYTNVTDRQDGQTGHTVQYDRANRFANGRPKTFVVVIRSSPIVGWRRCVTPE